MSAWHTEHQPLGEMKCAFTRNMLCEELYGRWHVSNLDFSDLFCFLWSRYTAGGLNSYAFYRLFGKQLRQSCPCATEIKEVRHLSAT